MTVSTLCIVFLECCAATERNLRRLGFMGWMSSVDRRPLLRNCWLSGLSEQQRWARVEANMSGALGRATTWSWSYQHGTLQSYASPDRRKNGDAFFTSHMSEVWKGLTNLYWNLWFIGFWVMCKLWIDYRKRKMIVLCYWFVFAYFSVIDDLNYRAVLDN